MSFLGVGDLYGPADSRRLSVINVRPRSKGISDKSIERSEISAMRNVEVSGVRTTGTARTYLDGMVALLLSHATSVGNPSSGSVARSKMRNATFVGEIASELGDQSFSEVRTIHPGRAGQRFERLYEI